MRSSAGRKRRAHSPKTARAVLESRTVTLAHCAQHIGTAPIAVLVLIAAAAPLVWSFPEFPTLELHPARMPSAFSLLIFTLALASIVAHLLKRNPRADSGEARISAINVVLLSFIAFCAASCIDSISRWDSAIEMVNTLSFCTAFIIASSVRAEWALAFLLAISIGGYVESLIALREYCASYAAGLKDWRAFGTFQNPNLLGGYMAMCLPVVLALALHFKRASFKFVCWVASLLIALALIVSGSKGAFVALLFAMVAFGWLSLRQFRSWRVSVLSLAVGLMLIALVASIPTLRHRIVTAFSEQAHSWLFRLFVWRAALSITAAHPINGTGIGTFHLAYPRFTQVGPTFMAHNAFLQIASECGIAALLSFAIFIWLCLLRSARSISACKDEYHWLRVGSICGCISFVMHNLVDCTWYVPASRLAFALLLACSAAGCMEQSESMSKQHASRDEGDLGLTEVRLPVPIVVRNGVVIGIVIALFTCAFISLSHTVAALHALNGRNSKSALSAVEAFERAIAWEPFNARHRIALANACLALAMRNDGAVLRRSLREALTAIKLQPMRGANYHTLARAYAALGERSKAIEAYRLALKVNPHDTLAMIELGRMLELMGKSGEAVEMYERILSLMRSPYGRYRAVDAPTDINAVTAAVNLASLKLRSGCTMGELLQLKGDLELATGLGEEYLGFFHPQMGDIVRLTLDEAKHQLSLAYAYLSVVSGRLGQAEQSARAKRRALELNPDISKLDLGVGN